MEYTVKQLVDAIVQCSAPRPETDTYRKVLGMAYEGAASRLTRPEIDSLLGIDHPAALELHKRLTNGLEWIATIGGMDGALGQDTTPAKALKAAKAKTNRRTNITVNAYEWHTDGKLHLRRWFEFRTLREARQWAQNYAVA